MQTFHLDWHYPGCDLSYDWLDILYCFWSQGEWTLKALLLWTNFIMDVELIAHKFFLLTSLMFNFCERSCQLKSVSQEVQKQKRLNITKATFLKNSSVQS